MVPLETSRDRNETLIESLEKPVVPIIYDQAYDLDLKGWEWCFPFGASKCSRIAELLHTYGVVPLCGFIQPEPLSYEQIRLVHTEHYARNLYAPENLSAVFENDVFMRIPPETLQSGFVDPLLLAAGGTLHAAEQALRSGTAVNTGGGFHHAQAGYGTGFCLIADVAIAVRHLMNQNRVKRVLIVDTDAHQGNGNADIFKKDPNVFTLSYHQENIFPIPNSRSTRDIPFPPGITDDDYLDMLQSSLPEILKRFQPDLTVHVSGTDILAEDTLTDCSISVDGIAQRDEFVWREVRRRESAYVMVPGGGYSTVSPETHAKSIANIIRAAGNAR